VIVRVLTARVKPGEANQFNAMMREELPLLRAQPGLVYAKLVRRFEADGTEEVILFEEWRDTDALYGWAGPDLSKPRLLPGSEELLADVRVAHFEALDLEGPSAPASDGGG
jgi:heme-degrading monooxygenase HmoA